MWSWFRSTNIRPRPGHRCRGYAVRNRLIVHFFTGLLEGFEEIDCFQVLQEEIGSIVIRVVSSRPGAISPATEDRVIRVLREHGANRY